MFIFHFHAAFSLSLIALALGGALLVWAKVNKNVGTTLVKYIAYFIIVVAGLNVLYFGYGAMKHWKKGHFNRAPFRLITATKPGQNRMMQNLKQAQGQQQRKGQQ